MLLVLVPSVSNPAFANIFLIDNFTDDGSGAEFMICDDELETPAGSMTTFAEQGTLTEVLGDVRGCFIKLLIANPTDTAASTVVEADAMMYRHMSGPGVSAWSYLHYDGINDDTAPTGNARGLGVNLASSDDLVVDYSFTDSDVNVTATLVDSGGDRSSLLGKLLDNTNSLTSLKFDLEAFVIENGALNLDDIDEININFTNVNVATDFTIEKIHITMQMVGGEMYPVDTTALLLAGAELNAIWILPAIAAIGIGAFVVTRKRK